MSCSASRIWPTTTTSSLGDFRSRAGRSTSKRASHTDALSTLEGAVIHRGRRTAVGCVVACLLLWNAVASRADQAAQPAASSAKALIVAGDVGKPLSLTPADFKALP